MFQSKINYGDYDGEQFPLDLSFWIKSENKVESGLSNHRNNHNIMKNQLPTIGHRALDIKRWKRRFHISQVFFWFDNQIETKFHQLVTIWLRFMQDLHTIWSIIQGLCKIWKLILCVIERSYFILIFHSKKNEVLLISDYLLTQIFSLKFCCPSTRIAVHQQDFS